MEKRIGIIGIIITERNSTAPEVNRLLGDFGHVIMGRIGLPWADRGVNVIGLIVEADTDELGALTGRLGMLDKVKVKSILV